MEPKIPIRTWSLFIGITLLVSAIWALIFVIVNSGGMLISDIWIIFVVLSLIMGFSMVVLHWRRLPPILYLQSTIKGLKQNNTVTPKAVRTVIILTVILGWVIPLILAVGFFVVILPGDLWDRAVVGLLIGLMVLLPNLPGTYHSTLQQLAKPHLREEDKAYGKTFFSKWYDYLVFVIAVVVALGLFFLVKGL